ncbi:SMP-30/gluconolactonase/LRE family protein [Mycobacterium sp. 21AC1]|uniref:SMP-30/gluconolactonase/LRE family protein n=1 Tax=[Mycobacterium] appelbergii TaxID=2939269 RepID=UPI00293915F3|nr:SMP-30/gluconolactonase/LRE family protein [Mycobacterium sp. 21AC1]MDV3128061.1 SMP-30/gluconolactonase/LRE family protein [Mycobacterium sp. 21AC1]
MKHAVTSEWRAFGPAMELGEGARLIDGRLLLVDILEGRLHSTELQNHKVGLLGSLEVPLGAVAPVAGRPGEFIAAAGTGVGFLSSEFTFHEIADLGSAAEIPLRVNDGVCDPSGRFWAGVMAYEPSPTVGALYRVDDDLTVTCVVDGLSIPNGPAFDSAGTVMYLADSTAGVIYRFDVDDAGELHSRTEFARVAGSPDGMVVDAEGHVWSAIWGAGEIHRYAPSGELVEVVPVPARQPTSIAVGGGRVIVTSATEGLESPGPDDGRTFIADCAVAGLPTAAFRPQSGKALI